jgi:translocation and assembly module TamA
VKREVVVDHATREAEITFFVTTGPVARMGPVRFSGTGKVDTTYLQKRVPFKEGDAYTPGKVEALRGKLTSLGVFNSVSIKPATALNDQGELPIDVQLADRPPRSIGFGVSYETQLGFGINGYWVHRNLFGEAESLRLTAEINHIGQGLAITDTGFGFRADFRKPDWWLPGQDGRATAEAVREVLPAYDRNAVTFTAGIDRVISPAWQVRVGLSGEASYIKPISTGIWNSYRLLGVPATVLLNKANSDVNPTKGYRVQLDVAPYGDVGPNNNFFSILRLTGRTYCALAEPGRSVLALRASFGTEPAVDIADIPPDKLFYAGGGGSVRGFVYQSAGPRDAYNNPLGGASVVEASVEFRQRIGESFGAVAFVDAGSAYPDMLPNFSLLAPRVGAGAGIRYYTDFGPIRLDVGFPINRRSGDPPFGIYVSLGQAF